MQPNTVCTWVLAVGGALSAACARAGVENPFERRAETPEQKIAQDMDDVRYSPFPDKRYTAIDRLGQVSRKELIREFGVLEFLIERFIDKNEYDFLLKEKCIDSMLRIVRTVDPDQKGLVTRPLTDYALYTGGQLQLRRSCIRGLGEILTWNNMNHWKSILKFHNLLTESTPTPLLVDVLVTWSHWIPDMSDDALGGAFAAIDILLRSKKPMVKQAAFLALARLVTKKDPSVQQVAAIKKVLADSTVRMETRRYAAEAVAFLAYKGKGKVVAQTEAALIDITRETWTRDNDLLVRTAMIALAALATPKGAEAQIEVYNRHLSEDPNADNPELRGFACTAMGTYLMQTRRAGAAAGADTTQAIDRVIDKLVGVDANTLAGLPPEQARMLRGAILNDVEAVVPYAAQSLMQLAGTRRDIAHPVEALIGLLPDPNDPDALQAGLAEYAARSLRYLTNEDFGMDRNRWWEWSQSEQGQRFLADPGAALPGARNRPRGRRRPP